MQKIAAIDIGSNAIRMIIGNTDESWQVKTVENIRLPVRLGQDAFSSGRLGETTMQQALDAFLLFHRKAEELNITKLRAVATSAMREAANSDILQDRVLRATGIEIEIISGEEEARLIHRAVANSVKLDGKRAILVDIGGGSVEVTISEGGKIISSESFNMGTVRLLNKLEEGKKAGFSFRASKQPFEQLVREYAEAARRRIDLAIGSAKVNLCIGTGGNVEEMGKLRQKLFKGQTAALITTGELHDLIEKLGTMKVKDRIRKLGLRPDRADVILPAAIVLHMIAREARVNKVAIPNVGLKDGILLQLADELRTGHRALDKDQIWQSALRLNEKYQQDTAHTALTAKLAGQIFDQTHSLHNLGEEEKFLLELATLLHDVGHFINTIDHEKHGYYVLRSNRIIGLGERQQEIIASLVRYHRKSPPSPQDENFKMLSQRDRLTVIRLSAILRLADGMDVSHTGRVRKALLASNGKNWELRLQGRGDLMLEHWALNKRRAMFQDVFGVRLEIKDER